MNENYPDQNPLTIGSLMRSMMTPDYPAYVVKLLEQVKGWLTQTFRLDGVDMPYWELLREAPDILFDQLNWLEHSAALLPASAPPPAMAEAVILSLGEVDLTGAMRLAVDYSLIFSRSACRRVWIVADCWIFCDIAEYGDHIKAIRDSGVSLRFLLVTPWGWLEVPIAAVGSSSLPASSSPDDGRNRGRRRKDDD